MYYQVKVKTFMEESTPKGGVKTKTISSIILVQAETPEDAGYQAREYLSESMLPYEISGMQDTKIETVIDRSVKS